MKEILILQALFVALLTGGAPVLAQSESAGAVVLVNSASPHRIDFDHYLKLYLDYFDVPYQAVDVAAHQGALDFDQAALVILGHEGVLAGVKPDGLAALDAYVRGGGGVWSFDMATGAEKDRRLLPAILQLAQTEPTIIAPNSPIKFVDRDHYITAYKIDRPDLQTVDPAFRAGWPGMVKMPRVTGLSPQARTLVTLGGTPLVIIMPYGTGRIVQWTTYQWLDANILGFFNGLDDIVWRSLVWAARKPFVFEGNIPLVSMRIDDAYGEGDDFRYIDVINKYGIVPHISFFMDATSPAAARNLGEYTRTGKAETFVHSREVGEGKFFYSDFDIHDLTPGREASDETIRKNFEDLDAFFKKYQIKYARTLVTHWTDPGRNTLPYLRAMGIQFASFVQTLPRCGEVHPWPYQLYQAAGHYGKTFGSWGSGSFIYHPGIVLDYGVDDPSIFCVVTDTPSIKVDWLRPSDEQHEGGTRTVAGVINDGINMLRHELDSMAPTYFFTHELNIVQLEGGAEGLDRAFAGVLANLKKFHAVIPCGFDYFNQYNKNVRTIKFESAEYDARERKLIVRCNGYSDMVTKFHVFTEQDGRIDETLYDVPIYRGATTVTVQLK